MLVEGVVIFFIISDLQRIFEQTYDCSALFVLWAIAPGKIDRHLKRIIVKCLSL